MEFSGIFRTQNAAEDDVENWRKSSLLLNSSRQFRYASNINERREKGREKIRERYQQRLAGLTTKAALRFIRASSAEKTVHPELNVDALSCLVVNTDKETLKEFGGIHGIAQQLNVDPKKGLDHAQCEEKRNQYGANTYPEKNPRGFWVLLWEACQDSTLIILFVCGLVSLGLGIASDDLEEGWYDGAGLIVALMVGVLLTAFSDFQQDLRFRAVDKEKKKVFSYVQVTREGCRRKISKFDLVVGDIVHLSVGDEIPADGLLIEGHQLTVDESTMTGDSSPSNKSPKDDLFLISGTEVEDGSGLMLVTAVGMHTQWGNLMADVGDDDNSEPPLFAKLASLARSICGFGMWLALLTFSVFLVRFLYSKFTVEGNRQWGVEDGMAIISFFAIAVAMVRIASSEDLPLVVHLNLAFATKNMMLDKALVRHWAATETMGSVTAICSDKTGTLTTNKMAVMQAWVAGCVGTVSDVRSQITRDVQDILIECLFTNTNGDVGNDPAVGLDGEPVLHGSAMETALLRFGLALGGRFRATREHSKVVKEKCFHSARKKMGVLVRHPDEHLRAHWKGAPEILLKTCDRIIDAGGCVVPLTEEQRNHLTATIHSFGDQALKTLCLAYSDLSHYSFDDIPEENFVCLAIVGIKDPIRPDVPEAVQRCLSAGMKVRMVTGDNVHTATATARECGILTDGRVVEGSVFRSWSEEEMYDRIPHLQVMARSSANDKLKLVQCLQKLGEVVAVTGDGANDAPALHQADIAMAMGTDCSDVAKQAADVILLDDNFSTIVVVAKWGRAVYTNVQKIFQFHLKVTIVALVITVIGEAPLSAMQLLWIDVITDTLGPLALASEPPHDDLLKEKPIPRNSRFITKVMWRNIIGQVLYQLIVLKLLQYKGQDILHLEGSETEVQAQLNTMVFNALVFCQLFNQISSSEIEKLNVLVHALDNWVFLLIVIITTVLQWIIVSFMGKLANTVPLTGGQWLISVGIGVVGMLVAMFLKLIPVSSEEPVVLNIQSDEENGYRRLPASSPRERNRGGEEQRFAVDQGRLTVGLI